MHTPDCPPASADERALQAWARARWPQGQPTEVDVSTLPAAGAVTHPLRIPQACAEFPWVGVWGNFQGLRIGFSPTESFQLMSGSALAYPFGADIFLSQDTGGAGVVSFAVFTTREAALAFAGTRPSYNGKIPTTPAAGGTFTPADGAANPTLIQGSEDFPMLWNGATWDRAEAIPSGSVTGRAKTQDVWKSIDTIASFNTNNAGSTTIYTVPAGKVARVFMFGFVSAFTGAATIQFDRSAGIFDQYTTGAVGTLFRQIGPINMAASQTLNGNVTATGVGTLLVSLMIEERWAE